jgi:hypothetical protein
VVRPRSCRVIYYFDTPALRRRHQSFGRVSNEVWEEEDMKEFTRLVENSKKTWKPDSEELEVINLGTEQEKRELKASTLITTKEGNRPVSLLYEYADVFA